MNQQPADEIDVILSRMKRRDLIANPGKYAHVITAERAVRENRAAKIEHRRARAKAARKARRKQS